MAQGKQDKTVVSVVQGINSEASLINFPVDNFVKDEENFVLTRKGTHERRLGVDFEPSYLESSESNQESFYRTGGISTYVWRNVSGRVDLNVVVIREGNLLRFYKHNESVISREEFAGVVDLNDFLLPGKSDAGLCRTCPIADGFGSLFVVNRNIKPILISYIEGVEAFVAKPIDIVIRDFKGVEDGLAVDQRISSITPEHRYNLQNQGWPNGRINSFRSARGVYPSNADIWYHGKYVNVDTGKETWDSAQVTQQAFGTSAAPKGSKFINPLERSLSTSEVQGSPINIVEITYSAATGVATIAVANTAGITSGDTVRFSGTKAYTTTESTVWGSGFPPTRVTTTSRTYYEPLNGRTFTVINATSNALTISVSIATDKTVSWVANGSNFGQVRKTNVVADLGEVTSNQGYTAVEFAHGRAWYSGLGIDEFSTYVFFSRIMEDPSYAGDCFQEADPTSEHVSDLIASDGGHIVIPEAGTILKLISYDRFVLVFGTRGIWSISGRDAGFSATEYEVSKVSSINILGIDTVYNVEGVPIFFAEQGIYAITGDQVTGQLQAQSVSIESIQTEYEQIPYDSRRFAKAVYDGVAKNLYWFYKSAENTSPYIYDYDRVLVFSGVFKGFTKFKIERPSSGYFPIIAGAVESSLEFTESLQLDVVVGGDVVQVDNDDVFVEFDISSAGSPGIVMYTAIPTATGIKRTFSRFTDDEYVDWKSFNNTGSPFTSYIETGYDTFGDLMRDKQIQWLYAFFDKTEDGFDVNNESTKEGGCLVSVRYAWANNTNAIKTWGPQQAYDVREFYVPDGTLDTFETGFPIAYKKMKPRGSGKAVQVRFESEEGKTCHLLGWALHASGNTVV